MKWFIRSLVVFFWAVLISSLLYLPRWDFVFSANNTINVFAWGDILDPEKIAEFEKEMKIKINLNYYSSNEELLVKMKATKGEGYDLIIPSDYAVLLLQEQKLLKKMDRSKLNFWSRLNPRLLGHSFDPQNIYSIPLEWEIFGLGIDKDYFSHTLKPSWKLIFDEKWINYKIAMTNDPSEAIMLAAFYLYGTVDPLTPPQIEGVKRLLFKQKQWVEAYANFRGDYFLATKNCPVVCASSSYIWRTMKLFSFVDFVIPEEGTFITIENLCIPEASTKTELTYKLINFLYSPKIVGHHYEHFGFFPPTLDNFDAYSQDPKAKRWINATENDFSRFHFFRPIMSQQQMRDIWVELKK